MKIIEQTPSTCQADILPLPFSRAKYYNSQNNPKLTDSASRHSGLSKGLGNLTKSFSIITREQVQKVYKKRYRSRGFDGLRKSKGFSPRGFRVHSCMSHPGKDKHGKTKKEVGIDLVGKRARFVGIGVCGSIWTCPICSERILLQRRREINSAVEQHHLADGWTALLTITNSHHLPDALHDLNEGQKLAMAKMKSSYRYGKFKEKYGYDGAIKTLEINHGRNGWHPHFHELWFLKERLSDESLESMERELFAMWRKACKDVGIKLPSKAHGVNVKGEQRDKDGKLLFGDYLTKYAWEMTGRDSKDGKKGSRTPWDILDDLGDKFTHTDLKLWHEYCHATKGKTMIGWTSGLKDRFGIKELKNDDISRGKDKPVTDFLRFPAKYWYSIRRCKKEDLVLTTMENHGSEFTMRMIEGIYVQDHKIQARWQVEKSNIRRQTADSTESHMRSIGMIH